MEPKGLLPHSEVPTTCPYPEPAQSSPCPLIPLPEYPSLYYVPNLMSVFRCLDHTKVSVQAQGFLCEHFIT